MDSQITTHSTTYAYLSPQYPPFYDTWTTHLFPTSADTPVYLRLLAPTLNPTILDLSTGTGRVLKSLLPHLPASCTLIGIDHSPAMLARAAETFPAGPLQPVWTVSSASSFAWAVGEGEVDLLVFSAGSISHLVERAERQGLLKDVGAVLRRGTGRAAVSVLTECIPGKGGQEEAGEAGEVEYEAELRLPAEGGGEWRKGATKVVWSDGGRVRTDEFVVEKWVEGVKVWGETLKWSLGMFEEGAFMEDVEAAGLEVVELIPEGEGFERFYILGTRE